MISGITTTCFAASYAVAFLLELARLLLRHAARRVLTLGFACAGLLAQTLYLGYRAYEAPAAPLSSAFDWYLVAAWLLVVVYLYLTLFHPEVAYGIFILPLALGLIGAAKFANREPFAQSPAARVWGTIHGTFWLLGAVAVIVGFVAGLMYLLQSRRLKHKLQPTPGLRLPSLEWLERVSGRAIVVSVLMAGVGTLSGIVLNLINHRHQQDELPWSDPIVWQSGGMFAWLLAAALFNGLYKPARRGRKVAYLTIANFVFLAIFLAVQLLGSGEHTVRVRNNALSSVSASERCVPLTSAVCQCYAPPHARIGRLRLPVAHAVVSYSPLVPRPSPLPHELPTGGL
ncbi:MAG TPA: cytochrome c biogenesis protein CcsA [Pirellulales bacterium]|nr:cytochrome c biogenesis protein CcsA [Pirellulales bacterium]